MTNREILFNLYQTYPHLGNMTDELLREKLADPLAETPKWAYISVLNLRADLAAQGSEVE